jgi:hypothetical protein
VQGQECAQAAASPEQVIARGGGGGGGGCGLGENKGGGLDGFEFVGVDEYRGSGALRLQGRCKVLIAAARGTSDRTIWTGVREIVDRGSAAATCMAWYSACAGTQLKAKCDIEEVSVSVVMLRVDIGARGGETHVAS